MVYDLAAQQRILSVPGHTDDGGLRPGLADTSQRRVFCR